ncbi:hypothetical protein JCM10207_000770 [Rhodosporidiobolus poonsookiae]
MSRASTPFSADATSSTLKSLFQAELDSVHRAAPGAPKPEILKVAAPAPPAGKGAWGGGAAQWGQSKPGAMADGQDFLQSLAASLEKAKAASLTVPSTASK